MNPESSPPSVPMRALYSPEPITIDGVLDEPVWGRAESYDLTLPADRAAAGPAPLEAGRIRLAWDDRSLYVACDMDDTDIVQECDEDQAHHYGTGDVMEVFLKPRDETWYWEMYATPNGRRTAFFFPGRGRQTLPSNFNHHSPGLRVGAQVDGTLNNWRDRDRGWTAEMAIPLDELAAMGIPLDTRHAWTILIGRYNYGRYLPDPELSGYPALTQTGFHRHEEYAALELVR